MPDGVPAEGVIGEDDDVGELVGENVEDIVNQEYVTELSEFQ